MLEQSPHGRRYLCAFHRKSLYSGSLDMIVIGRKKTTLVSACSFSWVCIPYRSRTRHNIFLFFAIGIETEGIVLPVRGLCVDGLCGSSLSHVAQLLTQVADVSSLNLCYVPNEWNQTRLTTANSISSTAMRASLCQPVGDAMYKIFTTSFLLRHIKQRPPEFECTALRVRRAEKKFPFFDSLVVCTTCIR